MLSAALIVLLSLPAAAQDSFNDPVGQTSPDLGQGQQGNGEQQPPAQAGGQTQAPAPSQPTPDPQQGQDVPGQTKLDELALIEKQDFGVPPANSLHQGPMHGPTPASVPGGQVITTKGLVELMTGRQVPFVLLDILGGPEVIPGAILAVAAHQPGHFEDETQRAFGGFLRQITEGNAEMPIVLYCQSSYCWMSYNAALRAINLGYRNVLWYRGGIEAWKSGGQQTLTY